MEVTKLKIEKVLSIEHPDLSQITNDLYLSSLPKKEHVEHLQSLGIRMVISMTVPRAPVFIAVRQYNSLTVPHWIRL